MGETRFPRDRLVGVPQQKGRPSRPFCFLVTVTVAHAAMLASVSPYDETHALGIGIAHTPKLCRSARSPSGSRCRRHCCPPRLERRAARARTGLPRRVGLRRSNGPLHLVELPCAKRHRCPGRLTRVHASVRPRRPEARSSFRCKRVNDVGSCRYRVGGVARLVGGPLGFPSAPRMSRARRSSAQA